MPVIYENFIASCSGTTEFELPEGSQVLKVAVQEKGTVVWFLVGDSIRTIKIQISLYMTGVNFFPNNKIYVDTLLYENGHFVLHAFYEVIK